MKALAKYAFAADAWSAPEVLITHLQQQRRGFDFRSEGEDPKLHERVRKIQSGLLDHLLHGNTAEPHPRQRALWQRLPARREMMRDLTNAIVTQGELPQPVEHHPPEPAARLPRAPSIEIRRTATTSPPPAASPFTSSAASRPSSRCPDRRPRGQQAHIEYVLLPHQAGASKRRERLEAR